NSWPGHPAGKEPPLPEPENLLLTCASVEISAAAKTPTINVLAYSGGLMNVPGWGTVVIDLAGLDLTSPQVSLLADHDASLKGIVGHGQAVVRDGKLLVMGTLADATESAMQIIALAKRGGKTDGDERFSHRRRSHFLSTLHSWLDGRRSRLKKFGISENATRISKSLRSDDPSKLTQNWNSPREL
ncbi:MAG: hypothetical protein KDA80_19480, partial [Planctomycetaceae bacterium]|nr:hypothetical protein [Planctomycetaceae bacterium]